MTVDVDRWNDQFRLRAACITVSVIFESTERRIIVNAKHSTHVQEVCRFISDEFGIADYSSENPYFLTSSQGIVLNEIENIRERQQEELLLKRGVDIAQDLVNGLAVGQRSKALAMNLRNLVLAVQRNSWLAVELISIGLLRLVVQALQDEFHRELKVTQSVELCVDALSELLKYEAAEEELGSEEDPILSATFLRVLGEASFCYPEVTHERSPTLLTLLYLLVMFPGICGRSVYAVVFGRNGETGLFPTLIKYLDSGDGFASAKASALLSAAALAICEDEVYWNEFNEELLKHLDVASLEEITQVDFLIEQLLLVSLSQSAVFSKDACLREDVERLEHRVKQLEEEKLILKHLLRQKDKALTKMVTFVNLDNFPAVGKALPDIVRFGWDGIHWKKHYTLLHYAAECCEDPGVVELVALLATDINSRDDSGMRPLDYARGKNNNIGVEKVLERLRREELLSRQTRGNATINPKVRGSASSTRELRAQLASMKNLSEFLQHALDVTICVGWDKIEWPHNFTALHLAATSGHREAVEMLIGLGANANCLDDWGQTPVDYAKREGHDEVFALLEAAMVAQAEAKTDPDPIGQTAPVTDYDESALSVWQGDSMKFVLTPERKNVLESLRPELQKAISAVISKRWAKIKWPHDFSALHLAARFGSTDGVKLLMEASASPGLACKDDKGMLPIDYAKMKKFKDTEEALKSYMDIAEGKPSELGLVDNGGLCVQRYLSVSEGSHLSTRSKAGKVDVQVDLLKERLNVSKDTAELGLSEMRHEISRLRVELHSLVGEKTKNSKSVSLGTLLDEDSVVKYVGQLETFGRNAVMLKLTDSDLAGGNALNEHDAVLAVEQLDFLLRIVQRLPATNGCGGTIPPFKGKGGKMGPVAPGAGGKSEKEDEAADRLMAGKGAKAPPPPSGKGGQPPNGGKGPAIVKGSQGKPVLPAKGAAISKADGKGKQEVRDKQLVMSEVKCNRINWKKYNFGVAGFPLKEQKELSIWSNVADMVDHIDRKGIEDNFAALVGREISGLQPNELKKEEKVLQFLTISNRDQGVDSAFRGFVKKLPPAADLCRAVEELDESIVTEDHLDFLMNNFKLKPAWLKELADLKTKHPTVPFAEQERYIWGLGNIAGYEKRLMVWAFIRTYEEDFRLCWNRLEESAKLVECFRSSKVLPDFIGIFLAVGNYMNSHYPGQAQADGFRLYDIENAFKTSKDKRGKTIRTYAVEMFFAKFPDKAMRLLDELSPLWKKVIRNSIKVDSTEHITRKLFGSLDDCQDTLTAMKLSVTNAELACTELLSFIEDATDPFRLRVPPAIRRAKDEVLKLEHSVVSTTKAYESLLKYFGMDKVTAALDTLKEDPKLEKFVTFWDELFVQDDLLLKKAARIRQEYFDRIFLRPVVPSYSNMMCLYNLKDAQAELSVEKKQIRLRQEEKERAPRHSIARVPGRKLTRFKSFKPPH